MALHPLGEARVSKLDLVVADVPLHIGYYTSNISSSSDSNSGGGGAGSSSGGGRGGGGCFVPV